MAKGKYASRKGMNTKLLAALLAVVLLVGAAVGGTLAWLTDKTDAVVNTFTVGNIDIGLAETENLNLKMVPGCTNDKDPKVTVYAGSEACWVFVKVVEENKLDDFITYGIADGWTALDGVAGVYWREQTAIEEGSADAVYNVLACKETPVDADCDGCVLVNTDVTKADMDALTDATLPELSFTAYAIQSAGFGTAADAWEEVSK